MIAPRHTQAESPNRFGLLRSVFVLWSLALIIAASIFTDTGASSPGFGGRYLVFAALFTGAVILAPTYYEYRRGRFDFFHPLTFAAFYLFPAFAVGGLILAFGLNQPYFLSFIDFPESTLPLALGYVSLGFLSLTIGFYLPWTQRIATSMDARLPGWEWDGNGLWFGGGLLVSLGFAFNIVGFISGVLGFQRVEQTGIFDALIRFLSIFFLEGMILLWLAFFSRKQGSRPLISYVLILGLLSITATRVLFVGSRAELVTAVLGAAFAFKASGRKLRGVNTLAFGTLLVLAFVVGVVWATTFRNIKGSNERVATKDYVEQVISTADYISNTDPGKILVDNTYALLERIETVSSLGVVVANYERLAPLEEAYGMNNNIVNDALTAVVPRFLWPEKPPTIEPKVYGELYFNFSDNAFAITLFGDLLRNFGPLGIVPGMLLIGVYLRLIYSVLILSDKPAVWKKMVFYPLLIVISYEGFYSLLFPSLLRVLFVTVLSVLLLQFFFGRRGVRT